uniref:DUF4350 domain-containing protein n=1 Tax=Candidatus Electrothrix sp. TaxID=2170559 RepID=UPI00405729F9
MADPRLGSGPRRVALFALVLFFFGALSWLFALRLENGDFLPAYSSLRKDPMGTAVLYESLLRSGLKVQRNHDPLSRTVLHPNETLLIIGHHSTFLGMFRAETEQQALTSFVEQGGRLVITSTQTSSPDADDEEEEEKADATKHEHESEGQESAEGRKAEQIEQAEKNKKIEQSEEQPGEEDVADKPDPPLWAIETKSLDTEKKKDDKKASIATGVLGDTQLSLAWPNRLAFKMSNEINNEHWQVLLRLDNEPVLIQRQLGQGSIVLATSSFFLSNEAMLRDRQVALLAWLTGSPSRLIFDEFHHGLRSRESIAGLIRNHNLHGVIIILVLLAFLFVWKNSSSLLPRSKSQEKPARHRTGRDQFEGMVNTLRLHPPKNLVATALQQWEKSNRRWCQAHPKQLDKMRQTVQKYTQEAREQGATPHRAPKNPKNSSRERQQVTCYQSISRILHEKNKSKPTQE